MEIKTEELKKLDKRIHEFNQEYSLVMHSVNQVPNLFAIKEIIEKISFLKSELEKTKSENEFEKILIKNNLLNLEIQRAYLQYASTREEENTVELSELFFGKGIIEKLIEKIKNFNYEADWDFYLSYQSYSYKQYPSDSPDMQDKFKEILSELKKDVLQYAREHYGLDEKYDFDLILGQPYSQGSWFHPTTRRVEISPSIFFAYKDENELKINSAGVIEVIFHEFIGHALQEYNSSNLPLSIKDDSINTSVPTMNLHAEGVSQMAEISSIEFMKQFKEKYSIKDDYIKQRELAQKRKNISLIKNYFDYLKLKNLEDQNFDYKKEFLDTTNNMGAFLNFELSNNKPFAFFKNISYNIGLERIKQIYNKLIEEFGKENSPLINKAISTGLLNINVVEEFARYYIESQLISN